MFSCKYCTYTSNWSCNLHKHEKAMHKNEIAQDFGYQNSNVGVPPQQDQAESLKFSFSCKIIDICLKENFKLFVSGPSRCGKTVFV